MKAVYGECSCDLALMHETTVVVREKSEKKACEAFLHMQRRFYCGAPAVDLWTTGDCLWPEPFCHWHGDRRYWSIHGPGGHLVDVV